MGKFIDRKNQNWKLFLSLREIVDVMFAPKVTVGLVEYMKFLIGDHHHELKRLYPDVSLLPKHHFMVHYATALLRTGPLSPIWTMCFEAKH
jgi:hypothetical protein